MKYYPKMISLLSDNINHHLSDTEETYDSEKNSSSELGKHMVGSPLSSEAPVAGTERGHRRRTPCSAKMTLEQANKR